MYAVRLGEALLRFSLMLRFESMYYSLINIERAPFDGGIAMKKTMVLALLVICIAGASGCDRDRMSEVGFSLPDGDPVAGREAFLYMQCNQCHTIAGEDLPEVPLA